MPEFNFPEWRLGPEPPAADLPSPEYAEADAVREQQLNDQYLAGQRQILNLGEGAYYRQQGEAAIHAAPPAVEALQQLKDETLAQAGNDRQREALTKRLNWHHGEAARGIACHLAGQVDAWQSAVADNQVKTAEEEAAISHSDPAKVELFAAGAYSTRLRSGAQPPDSEAAQAMAAQARSNVYRRAIEAALAAGDNRSAIGLYEQAKGRLTPDDAAPTQGQIKAVTQRETAQTYLAGLPTPTPSERSTFFDAPKRLADADAAHQAATARNDADWLHDPGQRTINQHYIDVQFAQQKREIAEAKAKVNSAIGNWISTPRPDGRPQTDLPPPALWAELSPGEQQNVLAALKRNALPDDMKAALVPVRTMSDAVHEPLRVGDQLAEATDDFRELGPSPRSGAAPLVEPPPDSPEFEAATDEARKITTKRGVAPPVEPAPGSPEFQTAMTKAVGHPVVLPDGSRVLDPTSDTGHLMSPEPNLRAVAEAGRKAGEQYRALIDNPETADGATAYLAITGGLSVGQGGTFDYQREGNHITGFEQLRHFRNVSNFNVGLFCQQAGLSLDETLKVAGEYASKRSSNYDPSQPYGLAKQTAELITKGFKTGESGVFDRTNPP